MNTKLINQAYLKEDLADKVQHFQSLETFYQYNLDLFLANKSDTSTPLGSLFESVYSNLESELDNERWIEMENSIYLDKKAEGFWLISNSPIYIKNLSSITPNSLIRDLATDNDGIFSFQCWGLPSEEKIKSLADDEGILQVCIDNLDCSSVLGLYESETGVHSISLTNSWPHYLFTNHSHGFLMPYMPFMRKKCTKRELLVELLNAATKPISNKRDFEFDKLIAIHHSEREYVTTFKLEVNQIANQSFEQLKKHYFIDSFLFEDQIRADLAPYNTKRLKDTDQGHWSLWQDEYKDQDTQQAELPDSWVARDPKSDIHDGVVGIDFGTKSTVVVYQKDNVNIHPMRVGTGDLSKEIAAQHYENPTIMEFNDIDGFINAYQARSNKPYTKWQDLTISHTAYNSMLGTDSSQFNTYLHELKQWAGDKNRKLKVVDKKGKEYDLPPFLELGENDINPIEIYAYYLGLYINNMNNGIFLEYILSFPVTYEMPVRDKIIASFKAGLKKSLPPELGQDTINKLNVTQGASEPAAYALVALQAYDFDPEDDERVFYGVFDFGGGTTDFDFGIYREASGAKERRFDYVIEHFGAGGDKFLGGENLLELLAFEVFKKNKTELLAKGIQFEKHPEKDAFAGSEQLLGSSQEAKMNTTNLCEKLRPFWEGKTDDYSFDSGELSLMLWDINGQQHSMDLTVLEDELNTILEQRIERGVMNFFNALRLAFSNTDENLQDIDSIKIFLAGNSSRSRFVNELFAKHIAEQDRAMGVAENGKSHFEIFKPLGADAQDVEKPTGKTGVAFGLIGSREGGKVKVVDHNVTENNDIRFKFYLGESRKSRFKSVIDREIPFNQWVEFIDAGYKTFEVFYTEQPAVSTGQVSIDDPSIKKKTLKLNMTFGDAMVYIRAVSPTAIEYVVAHEGDIEQGIYLNNEVRVELV